jgi:DNA uptake protein ComE-like DNA-binding protein
MKHLSFEPVKNWFGYTRRERRSSFILLLLIVTIAAVRFVIPEKNISVELIGMDKEEYLNDTLPGKNKLSVKSGAQREKSVRLKPGILEINTCDSAALEALPGIGPVLSVRIIKYRNLLGGYASVSQLREVYGLSEETFNIISGRFTADTSLIKKIDINKADYKQLIRLPYFEKAEVSAILKYRELTGKLGGMKALIENKLIAADKADKVRPYLKFE